MGAIVALGSSLLWGSSDYLGGRATQRFGALRVLVWSQCVTMLAMWCGVLALSAAGVVHVTSHTFLIGAAGGVAGVVGLAAFYRALAAGPMVLVPPLAGCGVALPVIVGMSRGSAPTVGAIIGLLCAIVGVVLAAWAAPAADDAASQRQRIAPSTLLLCAIAACGFALIFVALDEAAGDSALNAIVATASVRVGSVVTVVLLAIVGRVNPRTGVGAREAARFAGIGLLDTGANVLFAVAAAIGRLEVASVLGSLYPAVTSALAALLLGERIASRQLLGVVLTIAGVALLATG